MSNLENDFARRTVVGAQCRECGHLHVPTRLYCCQRCGSVALMDVRVNLQGVFESWTISPRHDLDEDEFALGLVTLDAGPMLTVRIRLTQLQQPEVGAPVAGWAVKRPGAVEQFWFEPIADEQAQRGAA